jgi:HD-GYP domain-containing protein (c-di-GMP phosphodiesterase class II)
MGADPTATRIRLAELVAALSLGIDLGFGQPMEHVLRQCLIALRIAEELGLTEEERAAVYYAALLINVACHTDAHEQAKWFGDDIEMKSGKYDFPVGGVQAALHGMRQIGAGSTPLHRFRIGLGFALSGHREVEGMIAQHASLARTLAERLPLPAAVGAAAASSYERWDGKGWPGERGGREIPITSRIVQLAEFAEVAHRVGGVDAVNAMLHERGGKQFDPEVARLVSERSQSVFGDLDTVRSWDVVLGAEPALAITMAPAEFETALTAIADFVDLKSPYMIGHSRAVSELAASAGCLMRLPEDEVSMLRLAALVHGFGRLGVSNTIWDRTGPLGAGERERVRMHPYFTERMLHQSAALRPLGDIAVQSRELLDGSGYPRGLAGAAISRLSRVLGAADAYVAMREVRPHRPALSAAEAATELRADVSSGRRDADAVEAVLEAAGHRVPRRRERPAGLTAREVDVLRLLARGMSNKAIAAHLVIAPKTASNHVEHIYAKIDTSSRAAAGLFAVQHGLLPEEEIPTALRASGR